MRSFMRMNAFLGTAVLAGCIANGITEFWVFLIFSALIALGSDYGWRDSQESREPPSN